jgi:hypothetical protein
MPLFVNYLGASPRGIRWKQIFNFEASLGVLNPLAVPIKTLNAKLPLDETDFRILVLKEKISSSFMSIP